MERPQLSDRLLPGLGRRLAVVAVVALLAIPVVASSHSVRLRIDDRSTLVHSYAGTVGELLDQQHIELSAGQTVRPSPETPLRDGDVVEVVAPSGPPGSRQSATRELTVVLDGRERTLETSAATVGEALEAAGIQLGPMMSVRPGPDTSLEEAGGRVVVRRADFERVTSTTSVAAGEERRETDDLLQGETRLLREPSPGRRREVHRVTTIGGRVTDRELVSRELVVEPTPRVVAVGTATPEPEPEPPEPEPQPPEPEPEPEPQPEPQPEEATAGSGDEVWYELAQCESGGRWDLDGRYDGGLQFKPTTWTASKPDGYPEYAYQATPQQQIEVGKIVQQQSGWDAWGECAEQLGLS